MESNKQSAFGRGVKSLSRIEVIKTLFKFRPTGEDRITSVASIQERFHHWWAFFLSTHNPQPEPLAVCAVRHRRKTTLQGRYTVWFEGVGDKSCKQAPEDTITRLAYPKGECWDSRIFGKVEVSPNLEVVHRLAKVAQEPWKRRLIEECTAYGYRTTSWGKFLMRSESLRAISSRLGVCSRSPFPLKEVGL